MKRLLITLAIGMSAVLGVSACGGGSKGATSAGSATAAADQTPVTVQVWSFFTGDEQKLVEQQFASFHTKYPWITVKYVGNQDDDKTITAIRGGSGPDLTLAQGAENVQAWCADGAWQDLTPLITRDKVDVSQFPAATKNYTGYKSKQCGLPMLADAYGLYYNKDLLTAAGYSGPPKTWDELTAMAKKLTVLNTDGSIKQAGFVPLDGFYESNAANLGVGFGVKWYDANGKSDLATNQPWTNLFQWQKELVDYYGYPKLQRFVSSLGKEFSTDNAFYNGKVAMVLDGEWRTAFIKREKPGLNYGTAALPNVTAANYGAGRLSGTVLGIPKGSKHVEAAWLLAKYLATDPEPLTALTLGLNNVPTTQAVLQSAAVRQDPHFNTFLDIAANPHSEAVPSTLAGKAPQDIVDAFMQKWQAGSVADLAKGLATLDTNVDNQIAQSGGGQGTPP